MKKTYVKGIDINTIKIGDKIWFKEDGRGMEIGVVSRVEGTNVFAYWSKVTEQFIDSNHLPEDSYNYGTIKEEEEMQTNQNSNKHPQYDVIVHWASGGEIQYRKNINEHWADYPYGYDMSPGWSYYQFRIKPKTKEIKYRTALMKDDSIKVFNEDVSLDDAHELKQWLDPDWHYVSVEI